MAGVWKQYAKMAAQNLYLPLVYACSRMRPVKRGRVVFADAHHMRRPENMAPLIRQMQEDGSYEIIETYLDYRQASFGQVLRHMTDFMRLYATAQTVVLCDNFLPAAGCRKRRGTYVVQLWHACGALKKFGYDTEDDIPKLYKGNVFRNTDLVTVSAPFCEKPFSSAMRLPDGQVQALGVCRTDRYFDEDWKKRCREKLLQKRPDLRGRRIAVWAPTFRGSPGSPECISLDADVLQQKLCELTGEPWTVLVKLHPHMQEEGKRSGQNNSGLSSHEIRMSTEELFPCMDVLIADYSSLIYEYLLFDKPLVLYVPDYRQYLSKRGFYMPHEEIPGPRVYEEKDLPAAVREACTSEALPEYERQRKRFLEKYMRMCDGKSVERILEKIRERQVKQ